MELTEGFFIFLVSSLIGCSLGTLRMLYKSKCRKCGFCGISVERDVEGEERIDNIQIQRVNSNQQLNV